MVWLAPEFSKGKYFIAVFADDHGEIDVDNDIIGSFVQVDRQSTSWHEQKSY